MLGQSSGGDEGGDEGGGSDASSGDSSDSAEAGESGDGGVPDVPTEPAHCEGEEVVIVDGVDTGYHRCPDGTIHRDKVVACTGDYDLPPCVGTESVLDCSTDADCGDDGNSRCLSMGNEFLATRCGCVETCVQDTDCGDGGFCLCPEVASNDGYWPECGTVADGGCLNGDDCASGECGLSRPCNEPSFKLQCRSDGDACRTDSDCDFFDVTVSCVVEPSIEDPFSDHQWQCVQCGIGRPLHCEDGVRMAGVVARGDWSDGELLAAAGRLAATLTTSQREAARAHWTNVARMEHASVASFARFTLDLMTFGAPPELLALAQQAAADEVRHAELGFAVASGLADDGEDASRLGPGPMRLHDVALHTDLEAFATALVREGCVGETCGAAEAGEAARGVRDPALRAAMETIAADEQRHAVLAWKTLQWVWPQLPGEARGRVMAAAREEALALSGAPAGATSTDDLAAAGVLGAAATTRLRADVWRAVVAPTLAAMDRQPERGLSLMNARTVDAIEAPRV